MSVKLAVESTMDVSDVVGGFDDIGAAAKGMANDVESAASSADNAASRMDTISSSADNLGSSSAQAAGGLGDLGGALSAVPGPLGAVGSGMETLAPLVMGVTGATDLATLAMNSNVVVTTRARVATIAHAVASKATAAATKTYTAVQWALNAALAANPVGLVVIAILALVAGVVLAYQKSETFRKIVDTVMAAVKGYISKVVDVISLIPAGIEKAKDLVGKLPGAVSTAKTLVVNGFQAMTSPIQSIVDLIQRVIDKIGAINFPDPPDWFGKLGGALVPGRVASGLLGRSSDGLSADQGAGIYIDLRGAVVDPSTVARTLKRALAREGILTTGSI